MISTPRFSLCWVMIVFLPLGWIMSSCDTTRNEIAGTILEPVQPIFQAETGTHAIGGTSEQKLAQVFMTEREGTLIGLYLPLACASGELVIEIRNTEDDSPGESILSRQRFEAESILSDVGVFKYFGFPSVSVEPGRMLSFALQNEEGSCGMMRGPEGDSYPGGDGFYDARPNQPGWAPLRTGTGIYDLPFMIVLQDV